MVYLAHKDLVATKETMETEGTAVRRATEASLVSRVFPGLRVQMVNKAVPESLVHLVQEVLRAQWVHQAKKEALVRLGQWGLPVCGAAQERQDRRVLLVNLVHLALQVPLATSQLLLVISWATTMRACQIHFQSSLKIRPLLMTKTKLTQGSTLP